jgi:hypothetical protein
MDVLEIIVWCVIGLVAITVGLMLFVVALYVALSPIGLLLGLIKPSLMLDDEKPQTRCRVIRTYGFTSILLAITVGVILSIEPSPTYATQPSSHSTTHHTTTSSHTSKSKVKIASSSVKKDPWLDVRSNRSVKLDNAEVVYNIYPGNQFLDPIESQGGKLIVVKLSVKNTGNDTGGIAWLNAKLIDKQGRRYDELNGWSEAATLTSWLELNNMVSPKSVQLFPGQVVKTAKVFRVSSDSDYRDYQIAFGRKKIDLY